MLPPGAVMQPPGGYPVRPAAPVRQAAPIPPRLPVPPASASAQPAAALPKPVFRGVAAEQPEPAAPPVVAPAPLTMPSPTALGVALAQAAEGTDWTTVRRQLQELGATAFQVRQVSAGRCQFSIQLSTSQPGRCHRIDAEGTGEAEAVAHALQAARRWRAEQQ